MADRVLLSSRSRYLNTKVRRDADTKEVFFDIFKVPKIVETKPATTFRVTSRYLNRPDLIAHQVYNDVTMFWPIAIRNNILNPLTDMQIGQVLRIPNIEDVLAGLQRSTS